MYQGSRPKLHGLRPRNAPDEPVSDNARASTSNVLIIDQHHVEIARNGPDGLAKAITFKPDVLLCDIGLPGMDGYEVAAQFRSNDALRSTLLVALSGYAQAEDIAKAQLTGFDEHVAKPPTIDRLRRILATVTSRKDG